MKIKKLNVHRIAIPFNRPKTWGWSTRTYTRANILEITDTDGSTGYSCSGVFRDPEQIKAIEEKIIGKSIFDQEKMFREFVGPWEPAASLAIIAGIQTALYDLRGRKFNVPVYELLGGLYRKKVKIEPVIFIRGVDEEVKEIKEHIAAGFTAFNLKAGRDIDHDIELVKTLREEVGYDIEISLNFNMLLSHTTAMNVFKKIEDYDISYIFSPFKPDALYSYRKIKDISSIPISIHDGAASIEDAVRYCSSGAIDAGSVYIGVTSGIAESKKICVISEAFGLPVIPTAGELGISQLVGLHLSCNVPNMTFPMGSEYHTETDDIIKGGKLKFVDGYLEVTDKPGFGFEIDWDRVEKYKEVYKKVSESKSFDHESDFITYSMR